MPNTRNSRHPLADGMTMLTLNKAKQLGLEGIAARSGGPAHDIVFLDELTECRRSGWVFTWVRVAEPGANRKLVVSHEGEVRHLE